MMMAFACETSVPQPNRYDMRLQDRQVAGSNLLPSTSTAPPSPKRQRQYKSTFDAYGYNMAHDRSRLSSMRRNVEQVPTLEGYLPLCVIHCQTSKNSKAPGAADATHARYHKRHASRCTCMIYRDRHGATQMATKHRSIAPSRYYSVSSRLGSPDAVSRIGSRSRPVAQHTRYAMSWERSRRREPMREERQNFVAGRDRRLAGFVDEVRRDNAMRVVTSRSKNGGGSGFAALSGRTRAMKRSPSAPL